MSENIEHTLHTLRSIRLSPEARLRMREELVAYTEVHQVAEKAAVPARSPFFSFGFRAYASFAAFVLIVGGAGGTAYAAEKTLPGSILYPVKTHISEPIQTALVPSTKGRAAWHAILAERRLEEAATLASEDKLSTETQEELAANLSLHVEASAHNADELEESGDVIASLDARSDLEARLTAHQQILAAIAQHFAQSPSESDDTSAAVQRLLALVEDHKTAVEGTRLALQQEISPSSAHIETVASAAIAAKTGSASAHATSTVLLAKAVAPTPAADAQSAGAIQVAHSDQVRIEEVATILAKHATLFASLLPAASSTDEMNDDTASTTATTTATSTSERNAEDEE